MSKTTKTVLIVTGVVLVCLIGAGIALGLYTASGRGLSNLLGPFSGDRVTVDEKQKLDLDGISDLSVNCASGSITVQPGSEPRVEMTGILWASAEKEQYLNVIEEGGKLKITVDLEERFFNWIDVDITVYVPEDSGLNMDIACASADTSIRQLALGNVTVSCASGKASIEGCTGENLDIGTASGGITIEDCAFTGVNTICQSGNIDVTDTEAAVSIRCTSGIVTVTNVIGPLDINNTSGSVTVTLPQEEIDQVDIDVTSGSIKLFLNAEAAFDLYASTTSGGIQCEFDRMVSGDSSDSVVGDSVSGECNGGGVSVTLHTVSGGIDINKI